MNDAGAPMDGAFAKTAKSPTRSTSELIPADDTRRYIDSRINDLERSAQRSRWFFGVYVAVAWVVFAATFNAYFSWSRGMADHYSGMPQHAVGAPERHVSEFLRERALDSWVSRQFIEIPAIGGQVNISDAGIIIGLLIVLLSTWVVYAARRENHLMFHLMSDVEKYDFGIAALRYLKNQIHATQLLTPPSTHSALGHEDFGKEPSVSDGRSLAILTALMYFAGPAALLMLLAADVWSLSEASPLRDGTESLWKNLIDGCKSTGGLMTCTQLRGLAIHILIGIGMLVAAMSLTVRAKTFQDQTHKLIKYLDEKVSGLANQGGTVLQTQQQPKGSIPSAVDEEQLRGEEISDTRTPRTRTFEPSD